MEILYELFVTNDTRILVGKALLAAFTLLTVGIGILVVKPWQDWTPR